MKFHDIFPNYEKLISFVEIFTPHTYFLGTVVFIQNEFFIFNTDQAQINIALYSVSFTPANKYDVCYDKIKPSWSRVSRTCCPTYKCLPKS